MAAMLSKILQKFLRLFILLKSFALLCNHIEREEKLESSTSFIYSVRRVKRQLCLFYLALYSLDERR
jgi:hypothetical protein